MSLLTAEEKMTQLLKVIGNPGTCGSIGRPGCGAMIYWAVSKNGARLPLNPDGTSHFATCPNAREFRVKQQKQRTGYVKTNES